jgi:hypothetical protein
MTVLDRVSQDHSLRWSRGWLNCKIQPMDLACVETQIGDGDAADCEVRDLSVERVVIEIVD